MRPDERITIRITESGSCTLQITPVLPEDDGQFEVRAINPAGEATSIAHLTVKGKKAHNEKSTDWINNLCCVLGL